MNTHQPPSYSRTLFYPTPSLRPLIDSYCILLPSGPLTGNIPWHIMPDGSPHILFHVYISQQKTLQPAYHSRLAFVGPRSVYLLTDRKKRVLSFIIKLKPGAYPNLGTTLPLRELRDRSISFEALIGKDLTQFKAEVTSLALSHNISTMVRRFDKLLLDVIDPKFTQQQLAQAAIRVIDNTQGRWSMRELSSFLGVSERHTRSVFNKAVGLSPKRYARIVRLTETVKTLDAGFPFGKAQLALASGFYDQSHMIDEFQALVGASTDTFIAQSNREDVLMHSSDFSNT